MTNCNENELCTTSTEGAQAGQVRPVARPRFETKREEHALSLRVELPGVAREDVELSVRKGHLELKAKSSIEPADGPALRRHVEFRVSDYAMRWRLGENIDTDAIASQLRHGVLTLTLPLRKPERRTIEVN